MKKPPSHINKWITYPFWNCNSAAVKGLEWISNLIPNFIMDIITISMLGLNPIHVNRSHPQAPPLSHRFATYLTFNVMCVISYHCKMKSYYIACHWNPTVIKWPYSTKTKWFDNMFFRRGSVTWIWRPGDAMRLKISRDIDLDFRVPCWKGQAMLSPGMIPSS